MTMLEDGFANALLMAQRTQAHGATPYYICGLAVLAIAVVYAVYSRMPGRARSGPYSSTTALWQELCQAHGLAKVEAIAVKQLAEARGLEPTALIFVRSDAWEPQALPATLASNRDLYAALRERLFGESAAAITTA